jgi:hypothetical protein
MGKRPAPGRPLPDSDEVAVRDPQAPVKMSNTQYATLMLWLANDSNRNIVTGASGSATAGGNRFAGKAKVVPKVQGFAMLAAQINRDHPGSGWTADIASKKFLYLQGKYSAAKTASYRSDWGLSRDELTKGVTIELKLEGMCKDFDCWDRWFGTTQRFQPSNVQDSSVSGSCNGGGAAAVAPDSSSEVDEDSQPRSASDDQGTSDEDDLVPEGEAPLSSQLHDGSSVDRASAFMHQPVSSAIAAIHPVPAAQTFPPPQAQPQPPLPQPAKPPTQAQVRKERAKAKADELQLTKAKIMDAITANSSTSVNNSPRGTFDATYVATSQAKIEGLIKVETMRATSQKQIAADELRLSTMKLQFAIESAESDRTSRSVIQTEINITSLLNTDPSGGTARLMISLVAERAAATASAAPPPAPLSGNIAAFALSLAPRVPATVVAVVAPAPPHVEIIMLNSESKQ